MPKAASGINIPRRNSLFIHGSFGSSKLISFLELKSAIIEPRDMDQKIIFEIKSHPVISASSITSLK